MAITLQSERRRRRRTTKTFRREPRFQKTEVPNSREREREKEAVAVVVLWYCSQCGISITVIPRVGTIYDTVGCHFGQESLLVKRKKERKNRETKRNTHTVDSGRQQQLCNAQCAFTFLSISVDSRARVESIFTEGERERLVICLPVV